MSVCSICGGAAEGPRLTDATGEQCHPACFAGRLPEDALVALIAGTLLALAPMVVVWAG